MDIEIVYKMMQGFWILTFSLCLQRIYAQYGTYNFSLVDKPTIQSSLYTETKDGITIEGTSEKAVDRSTENQFRKGSCTHTHPQKKNPWWAVDLGSLVTVFSVDLTNRLKNSQRLNQFTIYGSNKTFSPHEDDDKQLCRSFNGTFGAGVTRTFTCDEPIISRYLSVSRSSQILTLCEVGVRAVCPDGTYGEECVHMCSINCKNPPCDKFIEDGACPNRECKSGFKGNNCSEVCPLGTHGDNCQDTCSPNCKNNCFQQTGQCKEGCIPGYHGFTCESECLPNSFGQDCKETCHCKQGTCDYVTGLFCPGGCAEGYKGETCSESLITTEITTTHQEKTDSGSNQVIVAVVVSILVSSVVTLFVSFIAFRMWYRKLISKSKVPAHVKHMSCVNAVASTENVGHADYEIPFDGMSTVNRQIERKDTNEYQDLGETEVSKNPEVYSTLRVL